MVTLFPCHGHSGGVSHGLLWEVLWDVEPRTDHLINMPERWPCTPSSHSEGSEFPNPLQHSMLSSFVGFCQLQRYSMVVLLLYFAFIWKQIILSFVNVFMFLDYNFCKLLVDILFHIFFLPFYPFPIHFPLFVHLFL